MPAIKSECPGLQDKLRVLMRLIGNNAEDTKLGGTLKLDCQSEPKMQEFRLANASGNL